MSSLKRLRLVFAFFVFAIRYFLLAARGLARCCFSSSTATFRRRLSPDKSAASSF